VSTTNHKTSSHLIHVYEFTELCSPELHGLLECEPYALQEEAVLLSSAVSQVVGLSHGRVQVLHTQRERLLRQLKLTVMALNY